tara:strand:+ start:880 stop:1032 length:153 start_codon:yes stop_codon:yes gene_type:complete
MNKPTNAQELLSSRLSLLHKAKESNYSPDIIGLTFEEIDNIPCITEREVN